MGGRKPLVQRRWAHGGFLVRHKPPCFLRVAPVARGLTPGSVFQNVFETLYRPLPAVTARKAYRLRKVLLGKFRAFQERHEGILSDNVHHRVNIIPPLDSAWKNNPDYYIIELVTSLAILSTVGNITVWLIRYLFAHPKILDKVKAEVEQLAEGSGPAAVDLGEIRQSCPWLLASWYETLRLQMTGVPREAVRDFQLAGGERIHAGDIIFLPMAESNRDPHLWERPREFAPDRFIREDGKLAYAGVRKVKTFGVAGNLCPGRYHAFGVVMAVAVSFLLALDVREVGDGWPKPVAARSVIGGGFDHYADEVRVELAKKDGWSGKILPLAFSSNFYRN